MSFRINVIVFKVAIVIFVMAFELCQAQVPGNFLSGWTEGTLDIHEISTGRGSSTFFVLPDGTTMLYDAGEFGEGGAAWRIPRYVDAKPDKSRPSGEWILKYIQKVLKQSSLDQIDYALISHFHWDHMGQIKEETPKSLNGDYQLSGFTMIGDNIPIKNILDRGWPDYNYPKETKDVTLMNYRSFVSWQQKNNGLNAGRFIPGRNDQIVLQKKPNDYSTFEVRNLAANGEVWTGVGNVSRAHFPPLDVLEPEEYPDENMCSLVMRVSYGKFDYYTGGDIRGIPKTGSPNWQDIETPIAQVTGPVEVSLMNHHGYIDSQNAFFVSALRPQVWLLSVWDSAHPSPMVYKRLLSEDLYPGPRDIFTTNMHEANKLVVVGLDKLASDSGHIVVRVAPGGDSYKVIIIDDNVESGRIKSVHGPYITR